MPDPPGGLPDRPVILAPNHASFLDPVVLQAAIPHRIVYLMSARYYRLPGLEWLFRRLGCIPIGSTGSSIGAIRGGIEALRTHGLVAIFPEGRRSDDGVLQQGFPGVATLAARTGALVVPVGIRGTHELFPRGARLPRPGAVRVRFGRPIDFSRAPSTRPRDMTRVIMTSIADLLDDRSSAPAEHGGRSPASER